MYTIMSHWKRYRHWLAVLPALLAIVLLFPAQLRAQGGDGSISGIVHDQTGAVIPGANVVLTNQLNNTLRVTKTNGVGVFSFVAVPPSTYSITVGLKGFNQYLQKNIALHVGDSLAFNNISLKAGATSTTVEVNGAATDIIPTDTGVKAYTIQSKQIQNLAIIGRSAIQLLQILPGVVNNGYNGATTAFNQGVGSYNINGERSDAVALTNDGADVVDPGCNCGEAVTPNVDMLSEVTVKTSNFTADTNKGPVVIATVDKSGGSKFHGEMYYSLRDWKMDANDWQNNKYNLPAGKSKYQYPGFNIGGPVIIPGTSFNKHRDKLFFFAAFEWMRQGVDLNLKRAAVPTQAMRQGDFTDTSYIKSLWNYDVNSLPCQLDKNNNLPSQCSAVGMVNPAAFDPGGQAVMNAYPLPNADPATHNGYNYLSDIINPQNRTQQLMRVDYNISNNTKLYSRFDRENETEPYPYGLWWNPSDVPYPTNTIGANTSRSLTTSLTNVFSPTMTNEMVVAITRLDLPNTLSSPSKVSRSALGYPYRGLYKGEDVIPGVTDWGSGVASMLNAGGFTPTLFADKWINSYSDNLSKVAGNHLLKFGVYFEHVTNDQPTNNADQGTMVPTTWSGNSIGNAYADLLIGHVGDYQQSTPNITGNMLQNEFDFYGQDSWKVTPRLTVNYGLRAYHLSWMYDKYGRIGVFNPSLYNASSLANGGVYSGIQTNTVSSAVSNSGFKQPGFRLAPTVGFAYDLTGHGTTVLRGGFGTYYYRDQGNVYFNSISNPPYVLNSDVGGGHTLSQFDSIVPGNGTVNLTVLNPNDTKVPVTYSWSLTLSKRIPWSTVVEASYVGNDSQNQVVTPNINIVPWGSELGIYNPQSSTDNSFRPYGAEYATIAQSSHIAYQNYNSLQVTASRQTGRLSYSLAYTFSKNLGIGGAYSAGTSSVDPFNMRGRSYGVLSYDRTNILNISYNFLVPNLGNHLGNNAIVHGFLNGWQLSGISEFQSGAPLFIGNGISMNASYQSNITTTGIPDPSGKNNPTFNFNSNVINGTPDSSVHPFLACNPTANLAPQQIFNANCFVAPSPGNNGLYQLPYLRGPWYNNSDLSIFKNFQIGKSETRKLQLRFEAFNFLNHPLWNFVGSDPGTQLTYYNYGAKPVNGPGGSVLPSSGAPAGFVTNKTGHRVIQIAVKFFF